MMNQYKFGEMLQQLVDEGVNDEVIHDQDTYNPVDEAIESMINGFEDGYGIIAPDYYHPRIATYKDEQYLDMRHMSALQIRKWVSSMNAGEYDAYTHMKFVLPDDMRTKERMDKAIQAEESEIINANAQVGIWAGIKYALRNDPIVKSVRS